jgi:hypothetical protein
MQTVARKKLTAIAFIDETQIYIIRLLLFNLFAATPQSGLIVGCFENQLVRVLPNFMFKSDDMTLESCRSVCRREQYTFAGVDVSTIFSFRLVGCNSSSCSIKIIYAV